MTQGFLPPDLAVRAAALRDAGTPHAVATVVRVTGSTAAQPGARALLLEDGSLDAGFLGGGCLTGAVGRATLAALADGLPRLVALRPPETLAALKIAAGETRDGMVYARNNCPSAGSVDVFVEPVQPPPLLVVLGSGPVARALLRLSAGFGFTRLWAAPGAPEPETGIADRTVARFDWPRGPGAGPYVVIATQGSGDMPALRAALSAPARYLGLVASRRKAAHLRAKLAEEGADLQGLEQLRAPAGLDIGSRTPEEIALSILAEIVALRSRPVTTVADPVRCAETQAVR